jgi:hypothetical protein
MIGNFMHNSKSLNHLYALIAGISAACHGGMKKLYTKENATYAIRILFLFIRLISRFLFTVRNVFGVTNGIPLNMDRNLISTSLFLNNLKNYN